MAKNFPNIDALLADFLKDRAEGRIEGLQINNRWIGPAEALSAKKAAKAVGDPLPNETVKLYLSTFANETDDPDITKPGKIYSVLGALDDIPNPAGNPPHTYPSDFFITPLEITISGSLSLMDAVEATFTMSNSNMT